MIAQFPNFDQFVEEHSHDAGLLLQTLRKEIIDNLKGHEKSMHHIFSKSDKEIKILQWIIHPISVLDEGIHDNYFLAEEEWITE